MGYSPCHHKELDMTKRLITQPNTILSDTVIKNDFLFVAGMFMYL